VKIYYKNKDFRDFILCCNSIFLPFKIKDFGSPASGEHYFTRNFALYSLFYFDYGRASESPSRNRKLRFDFISTYFLVSSERLIGEPPKAIVILKIAPYSNKKVTLNWFQGLFMARFYKIYGLNFLFYFDYGRDAEINSA